MQETVRRLSPIRVLLAFAILSAITYGIVYKRNINRELDSIVTYNPWFAAYVDVTATPTYSFEQISSQSKSDVILSFIVSSTTEACIPTWGTHRTLEQAAQTLDLDRRIARLRQQGGKIAISFGGALNDELSIGCTEHDKLLEAYKSVIDRYKIDTVDIDIEGTALTNSEANIRRATVLARLQSERRAIDKNLAVWLTIPVTPQGMTSEGTATVTQMLANNVDLAGINIMTMDFGESKNKDQSMAEASKQALIETHRQLGILYKQVGINLSDTILWRKLGATPMIGQNDVATEIFTIEDAKAFNEFAVSKVIGRMSMWSANRDIQCGENYVDKKKVSNSCSGVTGATFSFTEALSKRFDGNLTENSVVQTINEKLSNEQIIDDPEQSPYQIWQEIGAYPKGVKVVWHGNVYEAKWWTKNDLPDNPVLQSWETPWQLLGPVLPNEKPIPQLRLPEGTYPIWDGTIIYKGGNRVLFEGTPFQAKWWNQGDSPAASAANPDSSPWLPLSQKQLEAIIERLQ